MFCPPRISNIFRPPVMTHRSLCKAAAISGLVYAFHAVLHHLMGVAWYLKLLSSWVQDTVDYVITYSICIVSIYGLTFSEGTPA